MSELAANGLYWAIVGDNTEGEPVRIQDGFWYSIGCDDPHGLDSIEIISAVIKPPAYTKEQIREQKRWADLRQNNFAEYRRQYKAKHGRDPGYRTWPGGRP